MNALTCQEQQMIQNLLDTGYAHAARAFFCLVKQQVSFQTISFGVFQIGATAPLNDQEKCLTLVLTDVLGELDGRSYLVLTEAECVAIQEACLPATGDSHRPTAMDKALLKEIDNILSAAMITKLSEALGLHIYGGVPQLFTLSPEASREKVREKLFLTDQDYQLVVSAQFLFERSPSVQPQFLWILPAAFLDHVQGYLRSIS